MAESQSRSLAVDVKRQERLKRSDHGSSSLEAGTRSNSLHLASRQLELLSHPDDRRQSEAADTPRGLSTSASYGLAPIAERTTPPS